MPRKKAINKIKQKGTRHLEEVSYYITQNLW